MSKESALLHRCCISCGSGGATRSSSVPCSFCIPFFFLVCCCLRCLASLHHQPQSEPSIISLTNTHTQCQHSSFDASRIHMEWKYGKNRVLFFSSSFFSPPEFYSCWLSLASSSFLLSSSMCVLLWGTDLSEKEMKASLDWEKEKEGDQRVSIEADNGPVSQHRWPTHPAASRPLQKKKKKSTRRSHYCPPSSVFTGMLEIVITSVRTEIFNLDVFVGGIVTRLCWGETKSNGDRCWHGVREV